MSSGIFEGVVGRHKSSIYEIRSCLATLITEHLANNQISQSEAQRRYGVFQERLSNLKRGKIDMYSIETMLEICSKIGIPVEVLPEYGMKSLSIKVRQG